MSQPLSSALGQQVIIDNKPGAAGTLGNDLVAKAPPDGHTLVLATSTMPIQETLVAKLPYDTLKDFTLIGTIASGPLVLVVPPSLPATNVRELIALAKQKPGALSYASPSSGSANHLAAELLKTFAGIDVVHVPYKGAAPAEIDLMGGRVHFMFHTIAAALPKVRAGQLRALAVTSPARSPMLPDVPTVGETVPGFEAITWYGVLAPAGLPPEITQRLSADINKSLQNPQFKEKLAALGMEPMALPPAQFAEFYKAETVKWGKIVKASGAKAD
ncbi:MAG: tripartite tricarboxylate transporter substrate binding protein [Sphingomicrobium sp.]